MGDNTTNISKDESILGGGKGGEQQTSFSRIPVSAHSADTKIENAICKQIGLKTCHLIAEKPNIFILWCWFRSTKCGCMSVLG